MEVPKLFDWLLSIKVREPAAIYKKLTSLEIMTVSELLLDETVQQVIKAKLSPICVKKFENGLAAVAIVIPRNDEGPVQTAVQMPVQIPVQQLPCYETPDLTNPNAVPKADILKAARLLKNYHELIAKHDDSLNKFQLDYHIATVLKGMEQKIMLLGGGYPLYTIDRSPKNAAADEEFAYMMTAVARQRLQDELGFCQGRLERLNDLRERKTTESAEPESTASETMAVTAASPAPEKKEAAKKVHFENDFHCEGCSPDHAVPPCDECAARMTQEDKEVPRRKASCGATKATRSSGRLSSSSTQRSLEEDMSAETHEAQAVPPLLHKTRSGSRNTAVKPNDSITEAVTTTATDAAAVSTDVVAVSPAASPLRSTRNSKTQHLALSALTNAVLTALGEIQTIRQPDAQRTLLAHHFLRLPQRAPNYLKVIKRPIALDSIISKLRLGAYRFLEQVELDLALMASNARTYNMDAAPEIYCDAERLREEFFVRCAAIRAKHGLPPHSHASAPPLPTKGHLIYTTPYSFVCDLRAPATAAQCALVTPVRSPVAELTAAIDMADAMMRVLECDGTPESSSDSGRASDVPKSANKQRVVKSKAKPAVATSHSVESAATQISALSLIRIAYATSCTPSAETALTSESNTTNPSESVGVFTTVPHAVDGNNQPTVVSHEQWDNGKSTTQSAHVSDVQHDTAPAQMVPTGLSFGSVLSYVSSLCKRTTEQYWPSTTTISTVIETLTEDATENMGECSQPCKKQRHK